MNILSIECSATPVSVAIGNENGVLANDFSVQKVTHSQTLMPMLCSCLKKANLNIDDIDCFAVSAGPGSFTGIRIGISTVKGLAAKNSTPCIPLSTLESMAYMHKSDDCIICPVMDARCNQLYNALFEVKNGKVTRLCEDRAIFCDDLAKELLNFNKNITVCGDGADVFKPYVSKLQNISVLDTEEKYQNALGVLILALLNNKKTVNPQELLPFYLRLPQAERELKEKKVKK